MAKVNHKRVKQLLNEKRSKITDRQFFTSRILAGHFEDVAMAQTKRYGFRERIHVYLYWKPKDSNVAWTDNACITINCGNRMVTQVRGRSPRYTIVMGLFAHELGHLLGTDFLVKQTFLNYLENRVWYPGPLNLTDAEDTANELKFWDYCKENPTHMQMILQFISHLENIFEDGYVENLILARFPGVLGYGLESLRKLQLENMPTVTEMIETETSEGKPVLISLLQNMLSYAKYGVIKYGDTPLSDMHIQAVFRLIPEMDSAVLNPDARERWRSVSRIMIQCWDYVQEYMEYCSAMSSESEEDGQCQTVLPVLSGSSAQGTGTTAPVTSLSDEEQANPAEGARNQTRLSAGLPQREPSDDSSAGNSADAAGIPEKVQTQEISQSVTEEEKGRIPFHQTEGVSEPIGGTVVKDNAYEREMGENAAADIERVLNHMAEKAACVQLENERLQELNETAQNISYGNIHAGVGIAVHRIADVDDQLREKYDMVSAPLLSIAKKLRKTLVQKLNDQQRGGKQTGLTMGRRLDAHALCRNDGKIFYRNTLPNETPRLSVGLLLDESGSMSSGDRCTYARAAAIILYDFCQSLDIPIMIYGHTTGYSADVDLYSYAEFEEIDHDDRYRLMDISARGCNRDGAALRFVAEQLSKRTEDYRILILVSDGQPFDYGYSGTAAEEDLRGIRQEYRRRGILFVAAGIGDDKEVLERIYGDSYLDITDLNQLPVKLTAVIKHFIGV